MKHARISNGQLTFTDGRFYQAEDGQWVPSVTTILEAYPKPYALLQWMKEQGTKTDEVIRAAGQRGTSVHDMTEQYDRGEAVNLFDDDGKPLCSLEEWAMFERYVQFSERMNPKHIKIEERYVNVNLGWAGTVDRVSKMPDGRTLLIDIKTSNGVWDSYWLQLAAYWMLLLEARVQVNGAAILWLNAKTRTDKDNQGKGWQLIEISADELMEKLMLFRACRTMWLATCADREPKSYSYSLSHRKEVSNV